MKRRELKNILCNKFTLIFIILSIFLFILMYLSIKNEYFFNTTNYMENYLNYYVERYLGGNAELLIVDGSALIYVEGEVVQIFSSLYLYVITFGTAIFKIFTYIFPVLIFYIITRNLYDEFYKKYSISKIMRMGIKKYQNHTIIVNGIYAGTILIIPKILYFILLNIMFPIGISGLHFISNASFISPPYLYVGYPYNPFVMISLDLLVTFAYGFIISLISIIIISFVRKKSLSYLVFIFSIAFLSIAAFFLKQAPITSYISLYSILEQMSYFTENVNLLKPFIIIAIFFIVLFIATKIILSKKIKEFL